MRIIKWEKLPPEMQCDEVREYYEILQKKKLSLFFKRLFDICFSLLGLIALSPVFLILAIAIKIDSKGPVFYRQVRVTQYNRKFRIFKFRSMVSNADKIGTEVTVKDDVRVTKVGKFIRKCRLDEISQLIDVLRGTMTFVGTRPEATKYVEEYTPEMMATLLLPAGVTSECSIRYKNEDELLGGVEDVDKAYVEKVLPEKMEYNLKALKEFSFFKDLRTMIRTVFAVLGKDYGEEKPQSNQEVESND